MKALSIYLLFLFCAGLPTPEALASSLRTEKQPVIAGNWTLMIVGSNDEGRTINFVTNKGSLEGKYFPRQGPPMTISNIRLSGKSLQFTIAQSQLYFEMWYIGDHFEGKMTSSSPTQKIAAVPVAMTRKKK